MLFSPTYLQEDKNISLDTLPSEFPSYGNGDFREPALEVHLVDGTTVTDFRYKSYTINKGKPALKGLPATYVESDEEAETLEIILQDDKTGLIAALSYTVFNDQDVITRSVRIENLGKDNLVLKRVLSANVDFHDSDYDMLQLSGTWTRERHIHKDHSFLASNGLTANAAPVAISRILLWPCLQKMRQRTMAKFMDSALCIAGVSSPKQKWISTEFPE